jgi:hypothetical protein
MSESPDVDCYQAERVAVEVTRLMLNRVSLVFEMLESPDVDCYSNTAGDCFFP